jgi:hypothetical protein
MNTVQPWMEAAAKEIKGECCDNQCSNSDIHFVTAIIAAYHAHASAEERRRRQAGKTHWDGCWKDHLDCAVENVQREKAVAELILAGKKAAGMLGECTVSLELCTAIFKLEQSGVPQEDKQ